MKTSSDLFLQEHNIHLNDQQKQALERITGKTLLLAVPGSGKTTVIISRLGYMIEGLHINPNEILTLTFSKLGVEDLKKRYTYFFGEDAVKPIISTIHSFALSVIRTCQKRSGSLRYQVLEKPRQIIAGIYREYTNTPLTEADINEFERKLTLSKNLLLNKEEQKDLFGDTYAVKQAYEQYKDENKLIDFDDMLLYAYKLLKRNPKVLSWYQQKYKYIQIDEAQDNSKIQDALIRLLVGKDGNLFMVADEDQSIYGFRGAFPDWVLNFKDYYPEGKVIMMESNYRATESLTGPAGHFIHLNEGRYEKSMRAVSGRGIPAEHRFFETIDKRDQYIMTSIRLEGKDTAVLFRNNDSAVELVDILEREKIPFNLRESNPTFFSNFLMRDLVTFYRFAKDPTDFEAFSKIWYKCDVQLSRENFERLRQSYQGGNVWRSIDQLKWPSWLKEQIADLEEMFMGLLDLNPVEFLDEIYYGIGYQNYLDFILEDTCDIEKVAQKRTILETLAGRQETVRNFFLRLQELERIMGHTQPKTKRGCLTLSTIHGAKGLEFDKVFMIDVNKNILPAAKRGNSVEKRKEFLEEVRLFYVGVTRAKNELEFLSVGTPKSQPQGHEVSPFIDLYFNPEKIDAYLARRKKVKREKKSP